MDVLDLSDRLDELHIEEAEIQPFRFFDLPLELRLSIYELILLFPRTIDLDPSNYRAIRRFFGLFVVSHAMHDEATRVFYGLNTFRIFPIHGRFINTRRPLLSRLPTRYRSLITRLELRLGPGWNKPPAGWVMDNRLRIGDCVYLRILKIFVECDPASDAIFNGFTLGPEVYTMYSVELVRALLGLTPSVEEMEFDAYPGITKSSPLLQALVREAKAHQKRITWGPERGWEKIVEVNLASVMDSLHL
ncbi:hypothetical protein M011DRAFT_466885 [Sporormia fimetaria CBS 119925]|uniref:F-box domain-containing protein n=1 Tax=Sporormia fimetaria CBS 119925 TaxID=1340428 RepID=A0A6A6VH14_9PLEO|nr:hypothetical protein M011DRAFT_466885 [Sporormia fimetaria CBS 119925]